MREIIKTKFKKEIWNTSSVIILEFHKLSFTLSLTNNLRTFFIFIRYDFFYETYLVILFFMMKQSNFIFFIVHLEVFIFFS